jgi:hypothetical protein
MLQQNNQYNKLLAKLKAYARRRGISIYQGDDYAYCPDTMSIALNKRHIGKLKYLIYLTHELGHVQQDNSIFHTLKSKNKKIKICMISDLEHAAWKNGLSILEDLNASKEVQTEYIKEWADAWHEYMKVLTSQNTQYINSTAKGYAPEWPI